MDYAGDSYRLSVADLEKLFDFFSDVGYTQIGSVARDGAIMLEELTDFNALARGYTDKQQPGKYKLEKTGAKRFFEYTLGPQSFKQFLHPPRRKLWSAEKATDTIKLTKAADPKPMVFWGVRNCDLSAIRILDTVFLKGSYVNEWYQKAREQLVIIAASCHRPSANCFCISMGGSSTPDHGYDLNLAELMEDEMPYFLATSGSERASNWMVELDAPLAKPEELDKAKKQAKEAEKQMPVKGEMATAPSVLKSSLEHPHWNEIAKKCLSCANCTMVCPTCFCNITEDVTDLTGNHTERWLTWDSCFNGDFSYIHGGIIRQTTQSRYRQWMTHKLAHWHDQFDSSGCVGCGRCITWCPVGIDITEELKKFSASGSKQTAD